MRARRLAPAGDTDRHLSVYHLNARSLKKQLGTLRSLTPALVTHDVISFSETWLNDSVNDSELQLGLSDHAWFRRDRAGLGGGVACAVRASLSPLRLPDPIGSETLLIRLRQVALTLAVCYRPPSDDASLRNIATSLSALQPADCNIICVGDFNLPEITWTAATDRAVPVLLRSSNRAVKFIDDCELMGVCQLVVAPTRGPNVLDLMLARGVKCERMEVVDSCFVTDHKEVIGHFQLPRPRPVLVSRKIAFNYKEADFKALRRSLSLVHWGVLDALPLNDAVDMFYSLLQSAIADHVPTVTIRRKCPPWFDRAVRAALRLKEAAHRRMRRNPSTDNTADFSEKRKRFKSIACSKYYEYLKKLADDLKTNPKRFWTFLKSVGKQSTMASHLKDNSGNLVSDDAEKAEILNKTFASKFVNSDVNVLPPVTAHSLDTLPRFTVTKSAVRSALLDLNPNKACGPDNFSAKIILECSEQLVIPLKKICKKSVETGEFPTLWKEANIIPVPKKAIERIL